MSYTFVYTKKDGWWLKISTIEQLLEYWKVYDGIFTNASERIKTTKEFGRGMNHANEVECSIGFHARSNKLLLDEAAHEMLCDLKKEQYKALIEHGAIYINRKNGWNMIHRNGEQFVHKSELKFPNFKTGDIKIEKFPVGTHYYLYIDGVQIRDGDKLKWDSYQEAAEFAEQFR